MTDALAKLHTSLIDTIKGYDEAIKDAEEPGLRALFQDARDMHQRHHLELHKALEAAGRHPDDSGSFMATVHATVISVRAAVTGLEGAVSAFASGEERIVSEYDAAIEEADNETKAMLITQRGMVVAKIAELKAAAR